MVMDTIASATTLVPVSVAPAVSIVVPCYNGGRFLDGLMASLARQTFRDFDVVIVDDGSTDDLTLGKLAALRDTAPDALRDQVRVIHQANRGASAARNTGAREARADLLFMLDCDDTIEPTFLAEVVAALRAAPPAVGMAVAHMRLIGAETGVARRYFNRFDLLFTNTLSPGIVVRKESWRAAGGYDETMRDGYEDWDFSLRLAEAGFRAIEIAKPLYIYHVAGDDAEHSLSSGVHARRLYAKLWRQIRSRHAQSYGPIAIARLWWSRRHDREGRVALWKGLAGYLAALTLPDTVFNRLFAILQRRRMHAHT
jgi:glycosyltransferase involved in cell wall biosynthesis